MKLGSAFGAFLDPVADKVLCQIFCLFFSNLKLSMCFLIFYVLCLQLMVAATLILLCTKPIDVAVLGPVPWLLTVPSIAIIGREVRSVERLIVFSLVSFTCRVSDVSLTV